MAKGKGSAFEREIAKQLSLWWTEGERDDIFWRTNASGARFTARRKQGKTTEGQGGDITFTDPIGKGLIDVFSIELKTGYSTKTKTKKGLRFTNWCVLDLIDGSSAAPIFTKMWKQCVNDAEATERKPMLIFRRTLRSACVCLRGSMVNRLSEYFGTPNFNHLNIASVQDDDLIIVMPLRNFLEWCSNPPLFFNQIKGGV